jgi:GMP synthase (glutamine-hydrolysing)
MPRPDPTSRPLHLIKAGGTFPRAAHDGGDFEHWVMAGLGLPRRSVRVLDARLVDSLPAPGECGGVVMTGSHAMVTDRLPWMERLADWMRALLAAEVPYLGICFGHQLLAQALGGRVDYHPGGREIGTVAIDLAPEAAGDSLFASMPARFAAHAVHAQSVRELPAGAVLLAGNDYEPTHAFRIGARAWGVQFHPEFDIERMALYVHHLAPDLRAAGRDPATILAGLAPTPEAAGLLPRFAHLARLATSTATLG